MKQTTLLKEVLPEMIKTRLWLTTELAILMWCLWLEPCFVELQYGIVLETNLDLVTRPTSSPANEKAIAFFKQSHCAIRHDTYPVLGATSKWLMERFQSRDQHLC